MSINGNSAPKAWNVHRTNADRLEQLLNDHAKRGYDVHHIRSIGNNEKGHLLVVFSASFVTRLERDQFLAAREERRQARVAAAAAPSTT